MRCRVSNVGDADVSDTGNKPVRPGHHRQPQRKLRARAIAVRRLCGCAVFRARPGGGRAGADPFRSRLPRAWGRHHSTMTRTVSVSDKTTGTRHAREPRSLVKVLFLGANPRDTPPLRVDEEIREIQRTIKQGRERDNIQVETVWAVRPHDITQALIDFQPHFVHFAGHGGGEEGSFAAENDVGFAHVIPVGGLVQAFKAVGQGVRCVIVNACRTERLAQALAATGPCVIGMRQPVGDQSAIRFSIGFYQALAAGKPVETAFDVGVAQLMMTPQGDDALAPLLLRGHRETC